jgi:hypothetical protein
VGGRVLKQFVVGAAKIGAGIVISFCAIAFIIWLFVNVQDWRNESLKERKDWPKLALKQLDAAFDLGTMWREGQIYMTLEIQGYSEALRATEQAPAAQFDIILQDKGGFELWRKPVRVAEMTTWYTPENKPRGLYWSGNAFLEADLYRDFATWNVAWRGFPTATP